MTVTCRTCVFWVPPPSYVGARSDGFPKARTDSGQCRRAPPQNFLTEKGMRALWPIVFGDSHWCGEHTVETAQDAPE